MTTVSFAPESEADHHHRIWKGVDVVRRLSDRVVGVGPFGLGLDALLAFVPGANAVYTGGAGAYLMVQAIRTGASPGTVARMLGYLALDTSTSAVPIVGYAVDVVFPGHLMAANALLKDIEKRHGQPPDVLYKGRGARKRR